jgi:hypothetical protein
MSVAVTAAFVAAGTAAHNQRMQSEDASKARKTSKKCYRRYVGFSNLARLSVQAR